MKTTPAFRAGASCATRLGNACRVPAPSPSRLHTMKTMKTMLCRLLFIVVAALPAWSADPLTTAFQQGLLEEELNRNFTNAITAYERVVQGLDEQRPLAATALFRLAECYRKLGWTNEAVAAYQRVLRDFTEEATLTKLSRENLATLGFGLPTQTGTNAPPAAAAARSDEAEEADRLAAQLAGIERLKDDPEKQGQAVLAFFPDEGLKRMLVHLPGLQRQAAWYQANPEGNTNVFYAAIGPEGQAIRGGLRSGTAAFLAPSELQKQLAAIADRVRFILDTQKARLFVLQNAVPGAAPTAAPVPATLSPAELASIQEEIRLVEQEQLSVQRRLENGRASPADLRKVQRDLLELQRKLPENALPARQVALLEQEQQLLQENLQEIQKQIQVGAATPDDEVPVRRELLALQRELAAVQRAPAVAAAAAGGGPTPATNEEADEIKRIQAIIRDSPDLVNAHNATGDGGTPLHAAADKGFLAVTEYLLANKADVNAKDRWGRTPLHIAAQNGHKKLCEMLLAAGADVNAADNNGYTPLHQAAIKGYLSVAETLLAKGAQVNTAARDAQSDKRNSPLGSAALAGFPAMMELLLAHGADLEYRDKDGSTPLIRVVSTYPARESCVKVLLDKGANVNAVDVHGLNALAYAVRDFQKLVPLLLDHHAEIDARVSAWIKGPLNQYPYSPGGWREDSQDGNWTVLFVAVGSGDMETARLLLDRGANINAKAASGITPVHWAVIQNAPATLKLLLDRKADVNVRDSGGNTPLHYAVDSGRAELVDALLAAGADPNAPGWTNGEAQPWWPLFQAVSLRAEVADQKITKALLEHGADVNAKTTNGWTALHQAARLNQTVGVDLLVAHNCDVNAHGSRPKDEPSLRRRTAEKAAPVSSSDASARGLPVVQPGMMPSPVQPLGAVFAPGSFQGGTPQLAADKDVTPLHIAIANMNLELAKFLLDHGADVNARDADGHTPLHFAVYRHHLDLIRLLLDAKADPDVKDASGETPVAMAGKRSTGFQGYSVQRPAGVFMPGQPKDIIALLRERGAKEPPEPRPAKSIFETDPEKAKAGGKVSIFGAVRGNGLQGNWFKLTPGTPTSLSQTLLVVGFADNALMSAVKLTRVNPDTKQPETKTVSLLGLKRGEPVEEILLQDGDRVDVPKQSQ